MKVIFAILAMSVVSSAFAGSCKLSAGVKPYRQECFTITTKLEVETEDECRKLSFSVAEHRFFEKLDSRDVVLSSKYTFKDKNKKVKDRIDFEDRDEYCF